jgi:hypothetical protein
MGRLKGTSGGGGAYQYLCVDALDEGAHAAAPVVDAALVQVRAVVPVTAGVREACRQYKKGDSREIYLPLIFINQEFSFLPDSHSRVNWRTSSRVMTKIVGSR